MKKIYIAGPISKGSLEHNINQATESFIELAKLGYAPFCPHWSVYSKRCVQLNTTEIWSWDVNAVVCYGQVQPNEITYEEWMRIDFNWIEVSDAVLRLEGESEGADREVRFAIEKGIPVFYSIGELNQAMNPLPTDEQ